MKKLFIGLLLALIALVFIPVPVFAVVNWDMTGSYVINFHCTSGCTGDYFHTMNVATMNMGSGIFSGTGFYNVNPAYTWDVGGTVTGDSIDFNIDYTGLNSSYYVEASGAIAADGSMSGDASAPGQTFTWITTSGTATFNRYAEIVKPEEDQVVFKDLNLEAFLVDNEEDFVDWAVRRGTCAAATNTVLGNVDGHHDTLSMVYDSASYKYTYSASFDVSGFTGGMYCFVFNPREDPGEAGIRLTREFYIAEGEVSGGGQIIKEVGDKPKDWLKISFGGEIWDVGSYGYMGEWEVNFHNVNQGGFDQFKFHTTNITALNFFSGETCRAMNFTAIGEWNGTPGYKMTFRAGDSGEPNISDTIRVELRDSSNYPIYDTFWKEEFGGGSNCVGTARTGLDNGNIKIEF